jgi:hypothetical protein
MMELAIALDGVGEGLGERGPVGLAFCRGGLIQPYALGS